MVSGRLLLLVAFCKSTVLPRPSFHGSIPEAAQQGAVCLSREAPVPGETPGHCQRLSDRPWSAWWPPFPRGPVLVTQAAHVGMLHKIIRGCTCVCACVRACAVWKGGFVCTHVCVHVCARA